VPPPPPSWAPEDDFAAVREVQDQSLPSVGSRQHGTGLCRPCAWFWKHQGCANGFECGHCHLCPKGEAKARKQMKIAAIRQDAVQMTAEEDLMRGAPPGLGARLVPSMPPPPNQPPCLPFPGAALHDELRVLQQAKLAGIPLTNFSAPCVPSDSPCENCGDIFCTCPGNFGFARTAMQPMQAAPQQMPMVPQLMPAAPQLMPASPQLMPAVLRPIPAVSFPAPQLTPAAPQFMPAEPQLMPAEQQQQEVILEATTALPSPGSAMHASGTCTPCAWFWKPQGCKNAVNCGRCHFCGPGEVKIRKKAKMAFMAAMADQKPEKTQVSDPASMFIAPCGALILD